MILSKTSDNKWKDITDEDEPFLIRDEAEYQDFIGYIRSIFGKRYCEITLMDDSTTFPCFALYTADEWDGPTDVTIWTFTIKHARALMDEEAVQRMWRS